MLIQVAELLKKVEFIIVPVANPDGYEVGFLLCILLFLAHSLTLSLSLPPPSLPPSSPFSLPLSNDTLVDLVQVS